MPVQAVSIGSLLDIDAARSGTIHSVFTHAVNLELGGDMWTLLAADRSDLPFGIRLASRSFEGLGLQAGDRVSIRSGFLGIAAGGGGHVVDCRSAPRWRPAQSERLAPGLDRRLAVVEAIAADRAWRDANPMARAVRSAIGDPRALGEVLTRIVGCGPGLTPAGDDVLVGILAVLTATSSCEAGVAAARSLSRLIDPLLSETTDISAHLLRQASKGLLGRAVHELISALIADTPPRQMKDAARQAVDTGATSGADTCMGLLAFAPSFFLPQAARADA